MCLNLIRLLHKKLFLSGFAFAELNGLQGGLAKRTLTTSSLKVAETPLREDYKEGEGKPACILGRHQLPLWQCLLSP